jgi:single-strand DNA-binding protein
MAKSLNCINLSGHLCADPKLHTFDDGNSVANLRLAVNNSKKDGGEWVDDPLFIDVNVFGGQVEAIGKYLAKGSFVVIDKGSLAQPRSWQGDDGQTRFTMVVRTNSVVFGPKGGEGGGSSSQSRAAAAPAAASAGGNMFDGDENIPF